MTVHTEAAFEDLIEAHLLEQGWVSRPPSAYDAARALIPDDLLGYVRDTQPKAWAKFAKKAGAKADKTFLDAFEKHCRHQGVLTTLRKPFKVWSVSFRAVTFQPASGANPALQADYDANRLAVVRQVHHDPRRPGDSLDMVLFVNGVPVVTAELKNELTGQTHAHAKRQYKEDRDPDAPIFRFKQRALVNFAVGSDQVWMTTRLAGSSTFFLPFNRGHGTGAGNPPVPGKHRTCYLWEQIWERHSLLDILARFLHLEKKEDGREVMIFPRFHQLDAVRKLVASCQEHGAGRHYLIQHSAGSGKSNSIAWLAHRLASLHGHDGRKVYDQVVVLTDRRVLDQQLQDTIFGIDHTTGVVRKIEEDQTKSVQLAAALQDKAAIIICTLHSFGFVSDKLDELEDRTYAVIVDEAHSSQGGDLAKAVRDIIGIPDEEDDETGTQADRLARWSAERRKLPSNMSYFAFTATPKYKTLCLFGQEAGTNPETGEPTFEPFHLYSMRQAIDEGFILDVLRGYTTYKTWWKLVKQASEDPELDKKKASAALARFVSLHPHNIAQKTEVIIEHFRQTVMRSPVTLGPASKAMVVTGSRLHAVRYKKAFEKYIAEKGYRDIAALVAFSGEVIDPKVPSTLDDPYTEPRMNADPVTRAPLKESELPDAFDGDDYNVLIVANKYQTGFDQPKLCAMYVDKRLSGIQAVQTLSRLNRTHPGKEEVFVLDFVNERQEILDSFQTFYEGTTVLDTIDPQRLYELEANLRDARVYDDSDVEHFARVFFKPRKKQRSADNQALNAALDPAVDRFKALDRDPADEFRGQLSAFINLYGFLAQVLPIPDADLEKLYVFAKMLRKKLPRDGDGSKVDLDDDVALKGYRLTLEDTGSLTLAESGAQPLAGPQETGTGKPEEHKEKLSTLIELLNERYGEGLTEADMLFFEAVVTDMVSDDEVKKAVQANDRDNFGYVGVPAFKKALIGRYSRNGDVVNRLYAREELFAEVMKWVLDQVYAQVREAS